MKFASILLYSTILIIHLAAVVEPFRYLAILPSNARSHFIFGSALFKALAEKGHEVYVISAFQQKQPIKNYYEVPIEPAKQTMTNVFNNNNIINTGLAGHMEMSEFILINPNVQELMKSNLTFDAVICEVFFSEALFGFSEHFKAPLIILAATGSLAWNTEMIGSPTATAFVPHTLSEYSNRMTYLERAMNLAYVATEHFVLYYRCLSQQNSVYKKYFPHLKRDMYAVRKNAAAVLLNTHVSIDYPRPYVPNQIEVGGMHINSKPKPLPVYLEDFISQAEYGVVYFSVGTNLKGKYLPESIKWELLRGFKMLKQRVLWKLEQKSLQGLHENIFISDWFSQSDILAHENVKVFITHGGLLSITESVYHGKPIIGMPLFGDQFANMARAEDHGVGITLEFATLKAQHIVTAVEKIVNNSSYAQQMKEMSARFRDRPVSPLNLAVYWAEHVVRQKGAKYLHCAGLDLSLIAYYNIDIILIYTLVPLYMMRKIPHLYRMLRRIC